MDDYDNNLLKKDEEERQKKQRWILIKKEHNKKYSKRVGRVKRIDMTTKRRENYPCEEGERGT